MRERVQIRNCRIVCLAALAGLVAMVVFSSAPSSASAACPVTPGVFTTSWGGGSGPYNSDASWTNGAPSGSCDASITAAGTYTVLMTGGSVAKSMTIGGAGSNPTLQISAEGPNTNLTVAAGGQLSIASGAAITLKCNVTPSDCGAPNIGAPTISNAGTITVDANVNGTSFISGSLTNTGTMQFNHAAKFNNGAVVNQGTVNIADGTTLASGGSSCGDTSVSFKNDAGGTLNATGAGTFNVVNYEQGAGPTSGISPVEIPCGSLKYTGGGASKVRAYGGFALTGAMQSNQSLTISDENSNTGANLGGAFTNNGTITLTCSVSCGAGGGPDFNAAGNTFTNAGSLTVAAAAGTGSVIDSGGGGTIINTGTIQFDQEAFLGGIVVNKGKINIADGEIAHNSGSSCGDTGAQLKNDTGGSINGTGTGFLRVFHYEQGNGTTSGSTPVQIPCGSLKYTGTGASTVQVHGNGTPMTGNVAAGQTLWLVGGINSAPFTNAGTIRLDQLAGSNPNVNVSGGTLTNTGTIATSGASGNTSAVNGSIDQTGASAQVSIPTGTKLSLNTLQLKAGTLAGGGTLQGTVDNSGGTVLPGASPGTLTVSGNYTQGAGGKLEIEINGTGAGQFDSLAVGGNATLGGSVALQPIGNYPASSAIGDSITFLAYGGTRTNQFASTTAGALACPKQLSTSYDDTGKKVNTVVSSTGADCDPPKQPVVIPGPATVPDTVLGKYPKKPVKTKKAKTKISFSFSSGMAAATFECKLDKGKYAACASPMSYGLKPGKHTISVRAVSAAGAVDPTPASFNVKVVKRKPKHSK